MTTRTIPDGVAFMGDSKMCPLYTPVMAFDDMDLTGRDERSVQNRMNVSYKDFSGELMVLERQTPVKRALTGGTGPSLYKLSIYDEKKEVTYDFSRVELKDVKFLGAAVSLG